MRICWVSPRDIVDCFGDPQFLKRNRAFAVEAEPLVIADKNFSVGMPFAETDVCKAFHQVCRDGGEWVDTEFWTRVTGQIQSGLKKWGCSNEEQFKSRCARLNRLYASIKDKGVLPKANGDQIKVAIDRLGHPLFVDGRHRLACGLALDVEQVPVHVIGRHEVWQEFRESLVLYGDRHRGVYQRIDHVDLQDLPYSHGDNRMPLLKKALEGYQTAGKHLMDVGAHWGHYSQQFERLGFRVTAVEKHETFYQVMERLRVATRSEFKTVQEALERVPLDDVDVILALSIWHHFLKTPRGLRRLTALLKRSSADMILFEAHCPDPPGQMANAHWNPQPDEFAAFIAEHSGLAEVTRLGECDNGRMLFRLQGEA